MTRSRTEKLSVEACKAGLEDIDARLQLGTLDEAEADAARLALLAQLRSSRWDVGQNLRRAARTLVAPAAVFLFVAAIGAAASYMAAPREATGSVDASSHSASGSDEDGEMLASLTDYTRSIGAEEPASPPADGKLLPDVNTMIERLEARLATAPEDVKGWQLLGWSLFQMQRYEQAASAYSKALALDPSSAAIKRSYEEAAAKASGLADSGTAPSMQTGSLGKGGDEPGGEKIASSEAPPHEQEAQIRSMVDRLADRLESSPRDVEGWTRLMRSRVVLGEREVAATAFKKALEVFKDDFAASSQLTAAATELGLKSE
jgi:cytochrome c-type biogenesis protein CcmH